MSDYREKLMSWQPESEGFSRDVNGREVGETTMVEGNTLSGKGVYK